MLSFLHLLVSCLLLACAHASPAPQASSVTDNGVVVTITNTLTATVLASNPSTASSTPTGAQPLTYPTSWLTVTAIRAGSPIHLLPLNAAGYRFYLGASTISNCPDQIEEQGGGCPPGNTTVLSQCSMGTVVPGGQQIYVNPKGELGYTEAHRIYMPPGSLTCPFTYSKAPGAYLGRLGIGGAFGTAGLMACPTLNSGVWQVLASFKNATIPMGNVSKCLGFEALAADVPDVGAWQYI